MKKPVAVKQKKTSRNAILVILGLSLAAALYLGSRREQPAVTEPASPATPRTAPAPESLPSDALRAVAEAVVPPFNRTAEAARPFPKLLPAAYFSRYPLVAGAYKIVSEIPEVIAQQSCYCFCDKFSHRSLLDCYASDHGAG